MALINDLMGHQDDILIAIGDKKIITMAMLAKLPPWRASLFAHVAEMAGAKMEVSYEQVHAEATRVGGTGTLWAG